MEALLDTPRVRDIDVAALLVRDQPISRIQRASRGAAVIHEDRVALSIDADGNPVLVTLCGAR